MTIDAIKIRTSVPGGLVVAGRPFSLTTTVTNAHEQPIEVLSYNYHIPYQVQWIMDSRYDPAYQELSAKPFFKRWLSRSIWKRAASPPGQVMRYLTTLGPPVVAGGPPVPVAPETLAVQTIQSGETDSYTFKAMMTKWLWISGGTLTFQGVVAYRVGAVRHASQFEVTFPYRPPLMAINIGAILGSILGVSAKSLRDHGLDMFRQNLIATSSTLGLTIILSLVVVVLSSRRTKEAQPVLTLEDIWGGITLGFLMGYVGQQFFEQFLPLK